VGEGVEVCLDVVEELVVGEGVVEVVNNAVVSTNTKNVELKVVAWLAFLDRIVKMVLLLLSVRVGVRGHTHIQQYRGS
jgi:hypothetical protein